MTTRMVSVAFISSAAAGILALPGGAQVTTMFPSPDRQIAAAVSTAPEALRAQATVLGFDTTGALITLRQGTNDLICLADDPRQKAFHVACYERTLDAFMASGRALRAQGLKPNQIDSARVAQIKAGRWHMPSQPAALYQYWASRDSVDQAAGMVRGASYLYVVYTPYATPATTGLSPKEPSDGAPWLMFPGKPWAHIMVSPSKTETITLRE